MSPRESWLGLRAGHWPGALQERAAPPPLACPAWLSGEVAATPSWRGYLCCRRGTETCGSSSCFLGLCFFPQKLISPITSVCWHPSFLGCGQLTLVSSAFRDSSPSPGLTNPFLLGMAALHEAVLTGNLDCVKLLVKYGADIHQKDENGWTPLHMACSDGYADIAR